MCCVFSVIIPTYNRAPLLRRSLDSVCRQTFTGCEVIVVDDGSTDGTEAIVRGYGERVQFFRQQNRGPGAARNLGLRHAKGAYAAFLDSDDLWFPWSLETYAAVIRQHGSPAFIAGKPFRFQNETELSSVIPSPLQTNAFSDYLASGEEWRWWGVSSFVVSREAVCGVGGFTDEWVNGEDADLALRLGEARGFVQVCAPHTFGYRSHAGNATKNLQRSLAGIRRSIREEQLGHYPGGRSRAIERRRIITRHIRPMLVSCLRAGLNGEAWGLYRKAFGWHVQLGCWKCLMGFPLLAVRALARRRSQ
jgi:glycosyltransferase involved in cell wall biosynthesis